MRKKILKTIVLIILLLIILCAISIWCSYNVLSVSHFTVSETAIDNPVRIVLVSDLHNHTFGDNNIRLVEKIQEQNPDLILLDGDMLNEDSEDSSVPVRLIEQLIDTAPVYYTIGNHEKAYMENGHTELISELEEAGATVLHYTTEDITVNGNELRLGGIYEYGFSTSMQEEEENERAVTYMKQWVDTDRYLIMCSHRPESFYCWDYNDQWGIDLQLSGHLHGGQVILPFAGGLFAPLQGFFPAYDSGQYEVGDCTMIITRGLGSNREMLPRLNNLPEIAVIDLV